MALRDSQTLDLNNQLPHHKFQFVTVVFNEADKDLSIKHKLLPIDAETVLYHPVRLSGPAVIYQDLTPGRKPWQRGHIFLRASVPVAATLLLFLPAVEEDLMGQIPIIQEAEVDVTVPTEGKRVFGVTIDGGGAALTTGYKGSIRVPLAGRLTKATLLSTDDAITSGDMVVDVWKTTYALYPPTVSQSIVGSNPLTLVAGVSVEDTTLSTWNKTFDAGSVFGFNVDSVASLTRVTIVLEYEPEVV